MPGWEPLLVCDGVTIPCNFGKFSLLIKNAIHDLVLLSTLMVVALLIYAGFIWLTSGGSKGKHDQAVKLLWNVVIGYLWILAAWVIVNTIYSALLDTSKFYLFLGN